MFCPYPFSRIEIKADGNVHCCCEGWLPKPIGNVLTDSLMKIWNGSEANKIRESILDQSFRFCTACPYLPGPAGPIKNQRINTYQPGRIGTLKLDYDQSCNLTCPSCRKASSIHFVKQDRVSIIHSAVLSSGALNLTDMLYITGAGDPFASKTYWHFLCNLPDLSSNPNMQIFLHTNGLLFDAEHWKQLGKTRNRITHVGISIDAACAETYALNRKASWTRLTENLSFIDHLRNLNPAINLGLFFVVQANNFHEMPEFVKFGENHGAIWISFTALRNWGTFTDDEYLKRAVHLPSHPLHGQFQKTLRNPALKNPIVIMDSFNPKLTNQYKTCNPNT
jgi:radical SAM protein with 4Fe4S-binding SPASM domain